MANRLAGMDKKGVGTYTVFSSKNHPKSITIDYNCYIYCIQEFIDATRGMHRGHRKIKAFFLIQFVCFEVNISKISYYTLYILENICLHMFI